MRQFGYVKTIPRDPHESGSPQTTLREISHRCIHDLGVPVVTGIEAVPSYIRWFYSISHPHIITSPKTIHIPMSHEHEALNDIVVEQERDYQWLGMTRSLGRIRGHVLSIMCSVNERVWKQFDKRFMEDGFIVVACQSYPIVLCCCCNI